MAQRPIFAGRATRRNDARGEGITARRVAPRRINALLRDIHRSPFQGIGKPEPLKDQFSCFWSRRIDAECRLVYAILDDSVLVARCPYRY